MKPTAWTALLAVAAMGLVVYGVLRAGDGSSQPKAAPRDVTFREIGDAPTERVSATAPSKAADASAGAASERSTEIPPEHRPGGGQIVPIDLTRVAPLELGKGFWTKLVAEPGEWLRLYEQLHAAEGPGIPAAPEFVPEREVILLIGLGERPRIDYAADLRAIAPRGNEARYRFKIETLAEAPVEVVTRPVFSYRVPRALLSKGGLAIVDEKGLELASFPALPPAPKEEER